MSDQLTPQGGDYVDEGGDVSENLSNDLDSDSDDN